MPKTLKMLGSETSNYLGIAESWWVTMAVAVVGEGRNCCHLGLCEWARN